MVHAINTNVQVKDNWQNESDSIVTGHRSLSWIIRVQPRASHPLSL